MTMSIFTLFGKTEEQKQEAETKAQAWLEEHFPESELQSIFDEAAKDGKPYHYIEADFREVEYTQAFADFQEKIAERAGGFAKASFNSTAGLEGRVDTITFWTEKPTFKSRIGAALNRPAATFMA